MATGKTSRPNSATGLTTTTSACGSRRLASAISVCTPDVVALATTPATASDAGSEKALATAKERGWTVVSMQNDFKVMFGL